MRIGLAGAGRMGATHARALAAAPTVDSVVVADPRDETARSLADQFGFDVARPVDLLKSTIDGLVIAAATDAHAELIAASVGAGIPVFCEKPVALDAASTRSVIAAVAGTAVPVYIGFQRRFDAGYVAARDAVRSGRLGWIHTLRACTLDPGPPTPEYVRSSGGFFRDCSVHDFDAIRWVTGQEVVEVYARGTVRGDDFFREADDVDTLAALLELSDGAYALVSATRYNAHGYDVRLEVLGSQRSISVGLDDHLPIESAEPNIAFPSADPYPMFMQRFAPAYASEIAAFIDAVRSGAPHPELCTLEDALEATLIAEACDKSRRERRAIRMDEVRFVTARNTDH